MNHTDYASMGASDLEAIKEVLLKKDFSFAEAARIADDTEKEGSSAVDAEARNGDAVDKDEQKGLKGSERNPDFASQHFHQDFVDWSGGRPPFELR